jgi:hypothetical protein
MKKMSATERRRLRKLGKFLATVNQQRFDMASFLLGMRPHPYYAKQYLSDYGTSACSLGWAAYLFPILSAEVYSFERLSDDLFGIHSLTDDWEFLFSSYWGLHDNSPVSAARRIHLYLKKGLPSRWSFSVPESEWEWS